MNENVGDSGVSSTRNPAYLTNEYSPFETNPRRVNIGSYFTGDSQYDETLGDVTGAIEEGLAVDDLRAEKQSNFQRFGNALINNVVIAGTTAAGGILGLADGILEAAYEGEISKIWDNEVNNTVADIQEKTREAFPIYRGKQYGESSIIDKLGTGIFWADLVQTLGFTEGMLVPGMGAAKLVSSAPKIVQKVVPPLTSAISEAATEAINARNDEVQNKTLMANQKYNELAQNAVTPFALNMLDQEYKETLHDINEDARKAGNFVFGANVALLSLSNALQFDKLFSRGFSTANRINGVLKREGKGLASKYFTDSLNKEIAKTTGKKLLDSMSEGFEELSQSVISSTPQNFKDYNSFNESKFNPEKREITANLMTALGKTFSETMNDQQAWTEFTSGFLIGALGVPMLKKGKIPVTLENNIGKEIYNTYKDWQKQNKFVDELNQRLQDSPKITSYYEGIVRHLAQQDRMNAALDREDTFDFKNAESTQFISDIQMFDEAGDIDNLKEIINNSIDLSDEGIANIIEETSNNGEGPFMINGNKEDIQSVREQIQEKIDILNNKVDQYIQDKKFIQQTAPSLSQNAQKVALYYKQQLRDVNDRFSSLSDEAYSGITNLIQAYNNRPKPKRKIPKGEGKYIKNEEGKKVLVHKDDIDYYDEEGNAILKKNVSEIELPTKDQFISQLMSDKEFNDQIFQLLNDDTIGIPYDERLAISKQLADMKRLSSVIPAYSRNLTEIIMNPTKADELIDKSIENAENNYKERIIQNIKGNLSSATTPQQLEYIIKDLNTDDIYSPYIQETLDNIKNDQDSEIKEVVKNYNEINDYKESLNNVISEVQDNNLKQSLLNIVIDAVNDANSVQDIKTSLNEAIEKIPEEYSRELKNVVDQVDNNSASKKASREEDQNQPKKKIKKRIVPFTSMDEVADIQKSESQEDTEEDKTDSKKEELKDTVKKSDTKLEKKLAEKQQELQRLPKLEQQAIGTNSEQNLPSKDNNEPYLRSWVYTKYNIDDLKDINIRRATVNDVSVVQALDALGAYDFIDEGKLGILFNRDQNIPIHYIKVNNDSRLKNVIVLAIEVTDEVQNITNPTTAFTAQDNKKYQAVGALGFNAKNSVAVKGYNDTVSKIQSEYKKYNESNDKPDFFVSQQATRIKHFYSGRMVKTTDETAPRHKSLSQLTQNPILGVYYDNVIHAPMIEDEEVVPLNENNANNREGSVWLMSREADGRYYAKAVQVKLFNAIEYNTDEYIASPIFQKILEDVNILFDTAKTDTERALAKYDLMTILYIPEEYNILFNEDNVSISNYRNNIGDDLSKEEKITEFIQALQDLNLRFQVNPHRLAEESYVNELLESDILITDLAKVNNVNASFDVYINPEQNDDVKKTGHTGQRGINNAIHSENYTLDGTTYSIFPDGTVKLKNDIITDQHKTQEVLFIRKVKRKEIKPFEGTNDLYIDVYSDTGEEFGIFRGKLLTKEELEQKKQAAAKKVKKEEKAEAVDDWFVKVPEELSMFNQQSEEKTEEKSESEDLEDLFVAVPEELSIFGSKETTEKTSVEPVKTNKKSRGIISEQFQEDSVITKDEIDQNKGKVNLRSKQNRNKIRELGFDNINELNEFVSNNNLPSIDTINTQEELDSLFDAIKNCR